MTTAVTAYAATSATQPLTETTITRRDVGAHDVAFDIHFAGICHSDIHTVRGEWGDVQYPMVPGHEIAGIVTEVGSEVTKYKVGDRVGVGCFVDSCRECEFCLAGEEQYCDNPGMVGTYNGVGRDGQPTQGGYSGAIVVDENYVLRIPDAIPLEAAAPLLCAGITTYLTASALERGPRHEGRRHRPRRSRAPGREAGGRARRRGHRAQPDAEEDGGRASARRRRVLRHQRPRHVRQAGGSVRPDPQHGVGQPRPRRLPRSAEARRHTGRTRHAGEPDGRPGPRTDLRAPQHRGLVDRRHRRNPGDARLLRRTRCAARNRGHRRRITSTRPTSACWPATCATDSSSTPRHCGPNPQAARARPAASPLPPAWRPPAECSPGLRRDG